MRKAQGRHRFAGHKCRSEGSVAHKSLTVGREIVVKETPRVHRHSHAFNPRKGIGQGLSALQAKPSLLPDTRLHPPILVCRTSGTDIPDGRYIAQSRGRREVPTPTRRPCTSRSFMPLRVVRLQAHPCHPRSCHEDHVDYGSEDYRKKEVTHFPPPALGSSMTGPHHKIHRSPFAFWWPGWYHFPPCLLRSVALTTSPQRVHRLAASGGAGFSSP